MNEQRDGSNLNLMDENQEVSEPIKQINHVKFVLSGKEKVLAVLLFPIAYIYCAMLWEWGVTARILLGVFTCLFLGFGEAMLWESKRTFESALFLVLTAIIGVSYTFEIGNVWEAECKFLFLHLFAVYFIMCRGDLLAKGETSHLFAYDGINGFCLLPFGNFSLWFKTLHETILGGRKQSSKKIVSSVVACVLGVTLFAMAMAFLKHSDANFEALLSCFKIEWNARYIWRIILSVPIACYLYGLIGGGMRTRREQIREHGETICRGISKLNKVPGGVWIAFIILFSIFYLLFFGIQGSYILDAFSMLLPEKYTFSEYARKGFGDMCAVMVINFVLMWLTFRTSEQKSKLLKGCGTLLMGESLVFALIAFLKLYMYIEAYGFTPLRLQSVWLVVVLSYACICILIHMFTGKKTAKYWFDGSAMTLALLTLF